MSGSASWRCQAVPMPETPAPTTTTSTHSASDSADSTPRRLRRDGALHRRTEATVVVVGQCAQRCAAVTLERRAVHHREARRLEVGERADRTRGLWSEAG